MRLYSRSIAKAHNILPLIGNKIIQYQSRKNKNEVESKKVKILWWEICLGNRRALEGNDKADGNIILKMKTILSVCIDMFAHFAVSCHNSLCT